MKIKISKSQWEEMGKKNGWIKTAQASNPVDPDTGITKQQFASYVKKQNSGKYNMAIDGDLVAYIIGVSKDKYLQIINNYDRLLEKWPDVEKKEEPELPEETLVEKYKGVDIFKDKNGVHYAKSEGSRYGLGPALEDVKRGLDRYEASGWLSNGKIN